MKYVGFNPELEQQHQSPDDWVFGAGSLPCIALIPEVDRDTYLPVGEVQTCMQDASDCATRGPTNIYEAKFNYLYSNMLLRPENRKWLEDNGYVQDGRITFSDRFNAVLSGTTRVGNSLKAPVDSIHSNGLIPKSMLPLIKTMTWDEYMSGVTQEMKDLGQEFLRRFKLNYERVNASILDALMQEDMIDVAVHAWSIPVDGEYPKTTETINHVVVAYKRPDYTIFDNYEESPGDFTKKLASDYVFFDTAYRVFISAETTPEDRKIQTSVFEVLKSYNLLRYFAMWWDVFSTRVKGIFHD